MNEGTLQIVFGASFSDHTGIDSYTPTIQVDTDPESLGRFQAVTVPLLGEVATTAQMFRDAVGDGGWVDQRNDIAARWHIWRFEKQRRAKDDRGEGLASAAIFAALSDAVPADAVIAVDVGNNTYSFGRYFESKQQDVLMSGYLGSIGFAFPAAMGAWAAVHDRGEQREIVAIAGDGGFGQYLADFTTAVKYGMNITLVLIHNGQLGKISKEQRRHYSTPASFLSLAMSSATSATFTPAFRLAGSEVLITLSRGETSTPKSAGDFSSIGFFFAFIMLGREA
jgi:thiamine pyrophosphate-dependent acetolactate synthase large subunit-like protein